MEDGITCMAFTVSFVPNTGNRYFMAATDEHVRLYDFEAAQVFTYYYKIAIMLIDIFSIVFSKEKEILF